MEKKKQSLGKIRILSIVITLVFLLLGFTIVRALIDDDRGKKQRQIQMVSLLKPPPPPPPPEIKEEPPEPEEEKIEEPEPETPEEAEADDAPMDDNLGVDAEGGAGGDDFGLQGKKGGRALIGGDNGRSALLRRYAWYYQIVEKEIRKKVNQLMEEDGGIPDGNLKAEVELFLDRNGKIYSYNISRGSGIQKMDEALEKVLSNMHISEMPPSDMPSGIRMVVSAKG